MTKLVRLILSLNLLLVGLSGCDNNGSPEPDGETMSNEQPDWPTATPPEGWVVITQEVEPEALSDSDPTALLVHRADLELGDSALSFDGSPIVQVDVLSYGKKPEEHLETALNIPSDNEKVRLKDREIDGVTFVGYSTIIQREDLPDFHVNTWFGQIPEDGVTVSIDEASGVEGASVLDELYAISSTIRWPKDPSWVYPKSLS